MDQDKATLNFKNRLSKALDDEIRSIGASKLAREIEIASGGRLAVDRRKLTMIRDGQDVKFSFEELEALDVYLAQRGKGLSTIFDRSTVLKALARSGQVTFLLGAKPEEEQRRTVIARWDVRSVATLLRALDRVSTGVHFEIEDVLLRRREDVRGINAAAIFEGEDWYKLLRNKNSPSLVCLGSPRACHAAEFMLAEMFGVRPFGLGGEQFGNSVPFRFIWTPSVSLPSSFATSEGVTEPPAHESPTWETLGVEIQGKRLLLERANGTWHEYGFLAAQRRPTGQIWLVIAGLTGPATFAAARTAEFLTVDLPAANSGDSAPVLWTGVQATVQVRESRQSRQGDNREVAFETFFGEPSLWEPTRGRPAATT